MKEGIPGAAGGADQAAVSSPSARPTRRPSFWPPDRIPQELTGPVSQTCGLDPVAHLLVARKRAGPGRLAESAKEACF